MEGVTMRNAAVKERKPEVGLAPMKQDTDDRAMALSFRAADLAPRHRAMLDFAEKLTDASWTVEEADREALREAGFSDRDIWDIAAVASFFNMSNRMASAVDMRPNREYHGEAR